MTDLAIPIPKINYDDFYKFVTSFTIIIFLVSVLATSYQIINLDDHTNLFLFIVSTAVYFVFAVVSFIFFIWAIIRWRTNQRKLDARQDAEFVLKMMQLREESIKYQKQMKKLAKENIFPFKFSFITKSAHRKKS